MLPKSTRFAIIGAGSAGLSVALTLKEHGYHNITVFEKENVIGGKCLTFLHEEKNYDLGANLTTPRYNDIRKYAEDQNLTLRAIPERRIVNVGTEEYEDISKSGFLKKSIIRLGACYYKILRHFSGIDRNGYQGLGSKLEKPFREWLKSYGLGMFQEMFEVLFVAYGYGHVMDLPAAYALKFFDSNHIDAAVNVVLGKPVKSTMDFAEGFQELWLRIVSSMNINVLTGTTIQSIVREETRVDITYAKDSVVTNETFDKLILACPLQNIDFLDFTSTEQGLFSQIKTYEYYAIIAKITGLPAISTYVYPYARKLTPGYPTVFYPPHKNDIYISYAYGDSTVGEDVVKERLEETIEKLGGTLDEIIYVQKWNYFPHVKSDVMWAGFYDRLEAIQGENNTFIVGEVMSFTLVELILDYSRDVTINKIINPC